MKLPEIEVIRGTFSLSVPAIECGCEEIVGVFGRSGSGKSTYLTALSWRFNDGEAMILPQESDTLDELTVAQNIRLGGLIAKVQNDNPSGITARFTSLIKTLELESLLTRPCKNVSGGQRQRVGVARVLLGDPPLLLLDEPFNGLGHLFEDRLLSLLEQRRHSAVGPTMVVSHDLELLSRFTDRVLVLLEGRLLGGVEPKDPFWKPNSVDLAQEIGMQNILAVELLKKLFSVSSTGNDPSCTDNFVIGAWMSNTIVINEGSAHPSEALLLRPLEAVKWRSRTFVLQGKKCISIRFVAPDGDAIDLDALDARQDNDSPPVLLISKYEAFKKQLASHRGFS